MDHCKPGNASTGVTAGETSAITRTKTMAEIIAKNTDQIIHQIDPSVPCLRSSIQKDKSDAVVSVLKRTRTMNEIIESNAEILHEAPSDTNHFLRSYKTKSLDDFPADDLFPSEKKARTTNDETENYSAQAQQLTRTKTMNEVISNNNLDIYQYLNETDHFLRSSRTNHPDSTSAIKSDTLLSTVTRTRTMNEIIEQNKSELIDSDLEGCSYSLRTRLDIASGRIISSAAKAEELRRLDEEYIDMQIRFNETRRKELRSVLEILSKSRLSHKRLQQESNDALDDIRELGEGSSHMTRKLELFRWLNKESVSRCQGLISEVIEMDRNLQRQLCQVDDLLSMPVNLAVEGNSSEPKNFLSKETEEKQLIN